MNPKLNPQRFPFIRDAYNPFFNRVFYWYTSWLFHRRFQAVWLDNSCHPPGSRSVLFIGNHNSWWDGLIPLVLNERIYKLKGRAMMDEEQLRKHLFFRQLGTFSINRSHPRKAIRSLQYAASLINNAKEGAGIGLWMYPEGKLVSPET
ncbi:lysophospholipid acyltransferase family protein, partial [Balneolaceae bacterium ANBcel3]|nr:lysophospholipid acyltransferase family protein [Balneolaceae bacterium ANBcel3]